MAIVLGIDTGGTYTDGVIVDLEKGNPGSYQSRNDPSGSHRGDS